MDISGEEVVATFADLDVEWPSNVPSYSELVGAEPELCPVYVRTNIAYLRSIEDRQRLRPGWRRIIKTRDVNGCPLGREVLSWVSIKAGWRVILVDWLFSVCERLKLLAETQAIALLLLDRFIAASQFIEKSELQLVGVTALFIAAKYEEIYP